MKEVFYKLINDNHFNAADGSAISVGILSWAKYLPEVSAGLSVVWLIIRIFVSLRDDVFKKKRGKDGDVK